MILSAIAAMDKNRIIGKDNKLPWDIPEDMKYFRDKTKGHVMIMGRKTFDSFEGKPLPGRLHIVITRSPDFKFEHPLVRIVNSLDAAVKESAKHTAQYGDEVFVIGGGEIYRQSLPVLDRIYLTHIEQEYSGDAKFPVFDERVFKLTSKDRREGSPAFSFCLYQRERGS